MSQSMRVAIIDYGSGNLRSAEKSFQRAARERDIAADIVVTDDPDFVARENGRKNVKKTIKIEVEKKNK